MCVYGYEANLMRNVAFTQRAPLLFQQMSHIKVFVGWPHQLGRFLRIGNDFNQSVIVIARAFIARTIIALNIIASPSFSPSSSCQKEER